MPALEAELKFRRAEIVVGEGFPLQIMFRNTSKAPVEVPNRLGPDELDFVLRRANQTNVLTVLNAIRAQVQRSADPIEVAVPTRDLLPPDKVATYEVDPSEYLLEPLAPGAYSLSVAFGSGQARFESEAIAFHVLPPMFDALAAVVQPAAGRISWCISHTETRKGCVVLGAITPMSRTTPGLLHRLAEVTAPKTIAGVAVAQEFEESLGETWICWLEGNKLMAAINAEGSIGARTETGPLELRQPVLQSVGWRPSADAASFAVSGLGTANSPSMNVVTFSHETQPTIKRFALASNGPPSVWRLGYRTGPQQWILVFAERAGASSRVRCQHLAADGMRGAPSAITLFEDPGPIVSLGFSPLAAASNVVDVLLGPLSADGKMKLIRVPGDAPGKPIGQWEIQPPTGQDAKTPWLFTISDDFFADPVIVAKSGAKLFARRAGVPDWNLMSDQSASAQHMRILLLGDQPCVTWSDRIAGLHLKFIR